MSRLNLSASLFVAAVALTTLPVASAQSAAADLLAARVEQSKVAGIDLVLYRTGVKDVVTLRGALPAGDVLDTANRAVPTLVGALLDRGTSRHSQFEIAALLDEVGASIEFSVSNTHLLVSAKCLRKDVPRVIQLLAEQLRSPAFSEEELGKVKAQLLSGYQRSLESPDAVASQTLAASVYPETHPNYEPSVTASIDAVKRATLDDIKAFHAAYYGPAHFTLVAVGDIDATEIRREVETAFAGWTGGKPLPAFAPTNIRPAQLDQSIVIPEKTSVRVIVGQATGMNYRDPDTLALRVGVAVLGSGFTSRLMSRVRGQEGLTYDIRAGIAQDTLADGNFQVSANFAPNLLAQGLASTRRELLLWLEKGVTDREVELAKGDMIGGFQLGLATTDGMANALLTSIQRGCGVTWLDELPRRLAALTTADVNAALRRHLDPATWVWIKAGTLPDSAK